MHAHGTVKRMRARSMIRPPRPSDIARSRARALEDSIIISSRQAIASPRPLVQRREQASCRSSVVVRAGVRVMVHRGRRKKPAGAAASNGCNTACDRGRPSAGGLEST